MEWNGIKRNQYHGQIKPSKKSQKRGQKVSLGKNKGMDVSLVGPGGHGR